MIPSARAVRLSWLEPTDAFGRLVNHGGCFWLDSSLQREGDARYSIMGCEPQWVFTSRSDVWQFQRGLEPAQTGTGRSLARLEELLGECQRVASSAAPHLPFFGGAVGWLSYDLGRAFEQIGDVASDDLAMADVRLAWYDAAIVWDHRAKEAWLVGINRAGHQGDEAMERLARHLSEPVQSSSTGVLPEFQEGSNGSRRPTLQPGVAEAGYRQSISEPTAGTPVPHLPPPTAEARSDLSRTDYLQRVEAIREGIARGEYYQLNLVQRFECTHEERPELTYLRLRLSNPAPFAAYIDAGDSIVLSSSPERFLEVSPTGEVRTCPIKGTRPRGSTEIDDAARKAELLGSPKERAELLMIVDLLRNDLGRVCLPGSVEVKRLHAIESFATVHHLVGEVCGRLRPEVTRRELLRAVFPGGSITGAPKVSAMRAIERLEPHRRSLAMGSLGYFSAHGRTDLNIAIRTILKRGNRAYVSVGAGIVWDSDPAAEYAETLAKAQALFEALHVRPV